MSVSLEDVIALETLEAKLRAILPGSYADSYEEVLPVSMGSAGLKFGIDGRVAWNEMWATFCDLAMAGGPPHRGTLLEPASPVEIGHNPDKYQRIVAEIRRGILLVTGLPVEPASLPGWVGVRCTTPGMAAWLVRAIVMENVLARHEAEVLYLPAGPDFQLAREIKNVVTVIAKTCHYWLDHMTEDQQRSIHALFANLPAEMELLQPASASEVRAAPEACQKVVDRITQDIGQRLGLPCFAHRYAGWIGIECSSVRKAVWIMRAMVIENVLARREGEVVFLPVSPEFASGRPVERLVDGFVHSDHLCQVKKIP